MGEKWTLERVAKLRVQEARNLRDNALKNMRPDVVALCEMRLRIGKEEMLRKQARLDEEGSGAERKANGGRLNKPSFSGRGYGKKQVSSGKSWSNSPKPGANQKARLGRRRDSVLARVRGSKKLFPVFPRAALAIKVIKPKLLTVAITSSSPSQWSTKLGGGGNVHGTELLYTVIDQNYVARNKWRAIVQVPNKKSTHSEILVRLERDACPDRVAVKKHGIWRKSIVFMPTSAGNHRDKYYAKVFEAKKGSGKSVVKRGEKSVMFPWLRSSYFSSWMRLKGTVATSNGADLEQQVLLSKPADHTRMIRTFFALRVWNLL